MAAHEATLEKEEEDRSNASASGAEDYDDELPERNFPEEDSLGFSIANSQPVRLGILDKSIGLAEDRHFPGEEDSLGYGAQSTAAVPIPMGILDRGSSLTRSGSFDEDSMGFSNAPMRMAIVGQEDDLSTIAGDTVAGGSIVTEAAVLTKVNLSASSIPIQRDFKEYDLFTPEKSKKNRWNPFKDLEDENRTMPETPTTGRGGSVAGSLGTEKGPFFKPSKRMYSCAACGGAILMLTIVVLAVAYGKISGDDKKSGGDTLVENEFDFDEISPIPSKAPVAAVTTNPTPAPVTLPTPAPFPVPDDARTDLLGVLQNHGVDISTINLEVSSPQYRSLQWLAADPAYFDYTDSRLIQRWALGVFSFGLSSDTAGINPLFANLEGWMDYDTNECDWFTTGTQTVCNGFGYYENLVLDDQLAYGTIPTEMALLSGSLKGWSLKGNNLYGSIPTEIGKLSLLEYIQLKGNFLTGEIPSELGLLTNAYFLGLRMNNITGTIPTELGTMSELATLGLSANLLTGPIPRELGDLPELDYLVLENNFLTGSIPDSLGSLNELATLSVDFNEFTGFVPWQVCDLPNLDTFSADCHKLQCDCCTSCSPTPGPTNFPTAEPTLFPTGKPSVIPTPNPTRTRTDEPTKFPTRSPTAAPIPCVDYIEWGDDCYSVGDELEVRFQICDPSSGDWIGIYEKKANPDKLEDPYLWAWTCGTQSCRSATKSGSVVLNGDFMDAEGGEWPLGKGDYHAYLIRNTDQPYEAILETEKLKIEDKPC